MKIVTENPGKVAHFVLHKGEDFYHYWRFVAANGMVLALCGVKYGEKGASIKSLGHFMDATGTHNIPVLDTYERATNSYKQRQIAFRKSKQPRIPSSTG